MPVQGQESHEQPNLQASTLDPWVFEERLVLTAAEISLRLRRRRNDLGLTQDAVAAAADLSTETIGRLERGTIHPNLLTFCRVAEALQTTASALLAESRSEELQEIALGLPSHELRLATVMLRALSDHVAAAG